MIKPILLLTQIDNGHVSQYTPHNSSIFLWNLFQKLIFQTFYFSCDLEKPALLRQHSMHGSVPQTVQVLLAEVNWSVTTGSEGTIIGNLFGPFLCVELLFRQFSSVRMRSILTESLSTSKVWKLSPIWNVLTTDQYGNISANSGIFNTNYPGAYRYYLFVAMKKND